MTKNTDSRHTSESLFSDLRGLGVKQDDTIFMHSSFKSLGPVQDGAVSVIDALQCAVGPRGLLLLPSFNLVEWPKRAEFWDIDNTPSTVGWLTEYFRRMPDVYRSDHYSHSVSARGKGAEEFVSTHLCQDGLKSRWDREPWGRTYGANSPMYKAYRANGKLLMLGVDYQTSTYCHLVEAMHWTMQLDLGLKVPFGNLERPRLGDFWERLGMLNLGRIGDAYCRFFSITQYVDTLLKEVIDNPGPYFTSFQNP